MQTVDDAGAAIESILMRMKEIAVQAQTSTTDADQRTALSLEYLALGRQWDRIVADTKWNGVQVMTGTDLDIGVGSGTHLDIAIDDWRSTAFGAGVLPLTLLQAQQLQRPLHQPEQRLTLVRRILRLKTSRLVRRCGRYCFGIRPMNKVTAALESIGKSRAELGAQ